MFALQYSRSKCFEAVYVYDYYSEFQTATYEMYNSIYKVAKMWDSCFLVLVPK